VKAQSLPGWHVLRNMLYIACAVAAEHTAVEFFAVVNRTALSYPCHDDHPSVSFWGEGR
jgi:hypothetical protein